MGRNRLSAFISIIIIVVVITSSVCAQEYVWSVSYGGEFNESGYEGLQTSDGGYAVLGSSYSFGAGQYDIYLLKLGIAGDTLWTKTYGGEESDQGFSIDQTGDNGLIIAGTTKSFGNGEYDVYLIRTDAAGDTLWSKCFGGTGDDQARSVRVTSDDGFIICGTTDSYGHGYSDIYLIKTDSLGDTVWTRAYGGSGGESGYAVRETFDGGFIAIGATGSFGDGYSSLYVVRVDAYGDSLWANTYGGTGSDLGYAVEPTTDGGFLLAGGTASFGSGYTDGYLVKIDSDGNVVWQKTYGGIMDDRLYSMCTALDGTIMLTGTTESYGSGKLDIFLIKANPVGDTIWTQTYGGSMTDYGRMIFQETGNDFIMIGESYSYSSGGSDVYVMKIEEAMTPVYEYDPDLLPDGYELAQNYPNPFNLSTSIEYVIPRYSPVTIRIYNVLGRIVKEWIFDYQPAGAYLVSWDGTDNNGCEIASGLYFYKMTAGDHTDSKKMLLIK
ncbi:MAG TPA: T9SS type A sorting domain-containing protein [candidate division Zixibacteria bacterium]|nr:T9SS type A sorting domain-containing protein [candidate division Zixibacteria bacterium]